MKISLIIPVYNTEKYVENCLLSCIAQDLSEDEYEIIVVNDGTRDNSMSIVNRLAEGIKNIIVINQENRGLSAARNAGMKKARGKYVWFIDSDDWIEHNCLQEIVSDMEERDLEGLVHAGIRYISDENVNFVKTDYPKSVLSGREYMSKTMVNCAAVKTIYKQDFLIMNKLSFFEGIYHEDQEFTPRAYYFIQRLGFTNHHYYYNRLTPGSITQKPNPKKAFDLIIVAQQLNSFKNSHKVQDVSVAFDNFIGLVLNLALFQHYYMGEEDLKKFKSEFAKNRYLFSSFLHSSRIYYKIEGLLFLLAPSQCVRVYSLFHK